MKKEFDPLMNSSDHMMKSGYVGSDTMRDFAHREFSHPNFEETERPPRSSYTAPTRDKAMPFKKGGAVKAKKSKLDDLKEFKTAKRVALKHPRPELEIEVFPAPGLKGPKQGMKKGGRKMGKACRDGGPIKSLMQSKHPVKAPMKKGGPKKKMNMGGMTNYAIGGVGKIRHKQASAKGAPLSSLPRSKTGR